RAGEACGSDKRRRARRGVAEDREAIRQEAGASAVVAFFSEHVAAVESRTRAEWARGAELCGGVHSQGVKQFEPRESTESTEAEERSGGPPIYRWGRDSGFIVARHRVPITRALRIAPPPRLD